MPSESSTFKAARLEARGSRVAALRKPAVALMIVAGLGFFGTVLLLVSGFIWLMYSARNVRPTGFLLILVFCYVLVMIVATLLTVAGAFSMRNCRHYWLAITACILTVLPLSIAWPLGLPIGLWALAVLTAPEERAAFARNATPSLKSPRERVHWPAISLIVAGLLDLAEALLCGACIILFFAVVPPGGKTPEGHHVVFGGPNPVEAIILGVPALVLGLLRLVGGIRMRRLQSYGFTSMAAVSSLLPVTLGSLLGVPASIWALIVLSQSDVKAAFALAKSRRRDEDAVKRRSEAEPTQHDISANVAATHQHEDRGVSSDESAKTVGDSEEYQRAAELAEIAPDWLAHVMLGLLGLGWILIGMMWNFRHVAVAIAIFAMFLIFLWIVQRKLVYLPKLRLEIRRQPNWKRLINGTLVALVFYAGMFCVIAGQVTLADCMTDPSRFAPTSLNGTDAEAAVKSALRLAHFKGLGDESAKLWTRGGLINTLSWSNVVMSWFAGMVLLFTAVVSMIHTRRYRYTWKYWWAPSLSVVFGLIVSLMIVHFIHVSIVGYQSGSRKVREIRCAASQDAVETGIDRWAAEEDYLKTEFRDWGIQKNSANIGQIHANHLLPRSWFDRYRASWSYVFLRPKPPLYITTVTRDDPADAYVRIEFPYFAENSPEEEMWRALLDGLEERIGAAAKETTKTRDSTETPDKPKK